MEYCGRCIKEDCTGSEFDYFYKKLLGTTYMIAPPCAHYRHRARDTFSLHSFGETLFTHCKLSNVLEFLIKTDKKLSLEQTIYLSNFKRQLLKEGK